LRDSKTNSLIPEARKAFNAIDPHWHDLRHEYACRLAERGVPITKIQYLLGHVGRHDRTLHPSHAGRPVQGGRGAGEWRRIRSHQRAESRNSTPIRVSEEGPRRSLNDVATHRCKGAARTHRRGGICCSLQTPLLGTRHAAAFASTDTVSSIDASGNRASVIQRLDPSAQPLVSPASGAARSRRHFLVPTTESDVPPAMGFLTLLKLERTFFSRPPAVRYFPASFTALRSRVRICS
jgi:Phage integrase family